MLIYEFLKDILAYKDIIVNKIEKFNQCILLNITSISFFFFFFSGPGG
jgi:hypothetical protein